ncbi:Scr1 family TA system antitoxin-like transcriptional regulator [Streptomyces mirabilis]|uniref:Scr1 family TA system antitoxin-like transcriptional regulator n=1 Tax=Streptomyces mirabilis TaxID=68239 RepID=UPI0034E95C8D
MGEVRLLSYARDGMARIRLADGPGALSFGGRGVERLRYGSGALRENPPAAHTVIHEAALHMRFGSPQTMREQLLRLIELARLPHVTIQVYPFSAATPPVRRDVRPSRRERPFPCRRIVDP